MAAIAAIPVGKIKTPVSHERPCPCGGLSARCGYCHGKGVYTVVTLQVVAIGAVA